MAFKGGFEGQDHPKSTTSGNPAGPGKPGGGTGSTGGGAGGPAGTPSANPTDPNAPTITRGPLTPQQVYSGGTISFPGDNSPTQAGNATAADFEVQNRYLMDPKERLKTPRDYWDAVGNLGKRYNDFNNTGNSLGDWLGNHALGMLSIGELDPTKQPLGASVGNPNASWGVDPIGLALSGAGMISGLPLGLAYQGLSGLTGFSPMISFDGYDYMGTQPAGSVPTGQPGHGNQTGELGRMLEQLPQSAAPAPAPAKPVEPQQGKTVITGSGTIAPAWPWNQVTNP